MKTQATKRFPVLLGHSDRVPSELVAIFEHRLWTDMTMRDAVNRLKQLIGWTKA